MPAFLNDLTPFYGTRERNAKGETLKDFLDAYDPHRYEQPSFTADILVVKHPVPFKSVENGLQLLMVKRSNHPSIGKWALPGGFVNIREDVQTAAARELEEETGISSLPMEQIHTWGNWNRDPRARIITVAHLALVKEDVPIRAGDDAADACFFHLTCDLCDSNKTNGCLKEFYRFCLFNQEKKIRHTFTIIESSQTDSLLPQYDYHLVENSGIAFDHPLVIGQGILYIKRLLSSKLQ